MATVNLISVPSGVSPLNCAVYTVELLNPVTGTVTTKLAYKIGLISGGAPAGDLTDVGIIPYLGQQLDINVGILVDALVDTPLPDPNALGLQSLAGFGAEINIQLGRLEQDSASCDSTLTFDINSASTIVINSILPIYMDGDYFGPPGGGTRYGAVLTARPYRYTICQDQFDFIYVYRPLTGSAGPINATYRAYNKANVLISTTATSIPANDTAVTAIPAGALNFPGVVPNPFEIHTIEIDITGAGLAEEKIYSIAVRGCGYNDFDEATLYLLEPIGGYSSIKGKIQFGVARSGGLIRKGYSCGASGDTKLLAGGVRRAGSSAHRTFTLTAKVPVRQHEHVPWLESMFAANAGGIFYLGRMYPIALADFDVTVTEIDAVATFEVTGRFGYSLMGQNVK